MVAESQACGGDPTLVRVHCHALIYGRLWCFWSGWVDLAKLRVDLTSNGKQVQVIAGKSDAMSATSPVYVWAKIYNVLHCWKNGTLVFKGGAAGIKVAKAHDIPLSHIQAISCDISQDWSRRTISVVTANGKIELASRTEWSVQFDPTYDGVDLLCDSSWLLALGRAIADTLDLPLIVHPDL